MTMPITRRTPDRTVRDEMAILERFGWRYIGRNAGGHHLFEHPAHGALTPMSSTPRNAKSWRRRHRAEVARLMGLNLFQFERLIAGQPLARHAKRKRDLRRRRTRRAASVFIGALEPAPTPVAPAPVSHQPRPDRTSCVGCGRPWLSDLDYSGRACPACGGQIIAGKKAA